MMPMEHMHISLLEDILITTCRQALAVASLPLQVTKADLATAAARTHNSSISDSEVNKHTTEKMQS
jgi:hypothetical protein